MYAKDISKKVRSSKKTLAKQGKFINSRAPYGYVKSPENKHLLVIDENVCDIVKRIFNMFISGCSGRYIADKFNEEGILSPNAYYYKSINKPVPNKNQPCKWGSGSVMNILKNPAYKGTMAQGKRQVLSFKNKKVLANSSENWIVVDGTHQPIIDIGVWDEVQKLASKNHVGIRRNAGGEISLFSGILVCADCGAKMTYDKRVYHSYTKEYYRCGKYINKGKNACRPHTTHHDTIPATVLADIRKHAQLAHDNEQRLIQRLIDNSNKFKEKNVGRYEKSINEKERRLTEIDSLIQSLFEEKLQGNVPETLFKRMARKYDSEQLTLSEDINQLKNELVECRRTERDISDWINKIKKCLSVETLTRAIVVELIESIEISQVYKIGDEDHQDIKIIYKFKDLNAKEKRVS